MIKIALTDDHIMLRKGLAGLVESLGYKVVLEADNGEDFIRKLSISETPDLVLMDINMPKMDGYETTLWIKKNRPEIRVLALSMLDDDNSIIRMLKNGAKGYVLKESEPEELKKAIDSIVNRGFHYSEIVTGKLVHSINSLDNNNGHSNILLSLNEREIQFLKLATSELTYKEIASEMHLSPRTIDGYRDALFEKLQVKTRVGLAIYAIRKGIVPI